MLDDFKSQVADASGEKADDLKLQGAIIVNFSRNNSLSPRLPCCMSVNPPFPSFSLLHNITHPEFLQAIWSPLTRIPGSIKILPYNATTL